MNSIRTKITLMTVCAIVIAVAIAAILGVTAVRKVGNDSANQMLLLLCETGEKNLDAYFDSVEQSVEMVSGFVETDLKNVEDLDDEALAAHLDRSRELCETISRQTHGILTYYYRIDPAFSKKETGFWYVDLNGNGFVEHEPTDITQYDTNDTSQLVWFTVPKATGKPIWLPPYITDNLDVRVISYNVPIYWEDKFVGVFGIEMDYSTMADQVDNIKLYDHGYAFINDSEGDIIYHPEIDVASLTEETAPKVPPGLLSEDKFIRYKFEGVEKVAVWLPLSNGMRLNVTVPMAEINGEWTRLIYQIIIVSLAVLILFTIIILRFTGHITRPLRRLTAVAEEVYEGNYDVDLDYKGKDEVGILTRTVKKLVDHLKVYIGDLNDLAYADALTSVRNKGAFDIFIRNLQERIEMEDDESVEGETGEPAEPLEFAIGIFDCDDLKTINDEWGHDKGDTYLKTACALICHTFPHSPVFRIGGDEFAVILTDGNYEKREELIRRFREESEATCAEGRPRWEQVHAAVGIAEYDPERHKTAEEVIRHADALMYEDKHARKAGRM